MAVYTVLDRSDIEAFIEPYGIGPLIDFEGVAAGIENSNYFISTDQSGFPSELRTAPVCHFVLTIFESAEITDLSFYVDLTTALHTRGLPVPCPVRDADGDAARTLQGKPALIVPRVDGVHPLRPNAAQCLALGETLARVHLACLDWGVSHAGTRSFNWLKNTVARIAPHLDGDDKDLLGELSHFEEAIARHSALPKAPIHGDLFRDNVLFVGNTLAGLIDFNSAGDGFLLLDLAVVVNDWCSLGDGSLDPSRARALIQAYRDVRPFTDDEAALWNDFLRLAALRFWVSRLFIRLFPESSHRPGSLVTFKDPAEFKNILLQRIRTSHPLDL